MRHPITTLTLLPLLLGLAGCEDDLEIGSQEVTAGGEEHECSEPGATRAADDGCNQCTCTEDHTWSCTEMVCVPACERGDTRLADDGCNECTCLGDGTWHCEDEPCEPVCEPGETRPGENGSPECTCDEDGTWLCPPGPECTVGEVRDAGDGCNTCTCDILLDGGSPPEWFCTTDPCPPSVFEPCTPGDTRLADDGCNTCECEIVLETLYTRWSCTEDPACAEACTVGEVRDLGDGCTTCECVAVLNGGSPNRWLCTVRPCEGQSCTGFDQELVNADGWVGNDPATTADDPLGIQGAWFTAGDGIACPNLEGNPCSADGCTVRGSTIVDPEWEAWGCMVALELQSTGGPDAVRNPYSGPVNCFDVELMGSTGASTVRIGFFDQADMTGRVGPFQEVGPVNGTWSGRICTSDVACPAQVSAAGLCRAGTGVADPYALYAQIVGGEFDEADVELQITSLRPGSCTGVPEPTCTEGATYAPDECTICTCSATGAWLCRQVRICEPQDCELGEIREAGDGCNLCECVTTPESGPEWECSAEPCGGGTCTTSPDELVNVDGWVGGDPAASDDDPSGVQGAFYAFGDGIACSPPVGNPCTADGCTIEGATVIDPEYQAWGCGMGLQLNAAGGDSNVLLPYDGPGDCFDLVLEGETGDAPVRLALADHAIMDGYLAPFAEIGPVNGTWQGQLCKWDVSCPDWALEGGLCADVTGVAQPYQLQIFVIGGDAEGPISLTLESLKIAVCD